VLSNQVGRRSEFAEKCIVLLGCPILLIAIALGLQRTLTLPRRPWPPPPPKSSSLTADLDLPGTTTSTSERRPAVDEIVKHLYVQPMIDVQSACKQRDLSALEEPQPPAISHLFGPTSSRLG
jgi:hypothetical protein